MADIDRRAERLEQHLRRSVGSARVLAFNITNIAGGLNGAVNAAANLAEGLASVSRNARIAASATGIGAIVAVIGTIAAATVGWKAQTKEVAREMRDIRLETQALEARGLGDKRQERELEIALAMERELDAAKKLENVLRKFPELQDAIRRKAQAARDALARETQRAFQDQQFDRRTETGRILGGFTLTEENQRRRDAIADRARQLRELERNTEGFSEAQLAQMRQDIEDQFNATTRLIEFETIKPLGDMLGRSFANSISDGIMAGIREGSLGEGFKALAGGILIGLGELMQEIGTKSLLAAKLFSAVVAALKSFAPAGAIGPALALIAAGGVLKGIGAALGGGGGGGGRGGFAGSGGFFSGTTIIDRGLVNPLNGTITAPGTITPRESVVNNFTIIGENDPAAQRSLLNMIDKGKARRGS